MQRYTDLGGRPVSTAAPHPAAWQPPTNHHTVYHAGLSNPLPFPKDYFTVAVLRFPAVSSETVQGNIIQECKRVLRTGGYLEMCLLDRDMVNMGPRTRKAVRQLKETTCLSDSTISLKPTSDSVQRQLGTQGFDNLRRCMVRIPVAGMVVHPPPPLHPLPIYLHNYPLRRLFPPNNLRYHRNRKPKDKKYIKISL